MSYRFLHITVGFTEGFNEKRFVDELNKARDWVHYIPGCWMVYSKVSIDDWYSRLKPFLGPNEHLFICKLDFSERQGWLPKWVWDWIKKPRVATQSPSR